MRDNSHGSLLIRYKTLHSLLFSQYMFCSGLKASWQRILPALLPFQWPHYIEFSFHLPLIMGSIHKLRLRREMLYGKMVVYRWEEWNVCLLYVFIQSWLHWAMKIGKGHCFKEQVCKKKYLEASHPLWNNSQYEEQSQSEGGRINV